MIPNFLSFVKHAVFQVLMAKVEQWKMCAFKSYLLEINKEIIIQGSQTSKEEFIYFLYYGPQTVIHEGEKPFQTHIRETTWRGSGI